jgi:hypothetical protein
LADDLFERFERSFKRPALFLTIIHRCNFLRPTRRYRARFCLLYRSETQLQR